MLDNRFYKAKPATSAGAVYNIAGPKEDYTRPPMQWNEGRIVCRGSRLEHWLNGRLVAEVDLAAPEWAATLEKERERRVKVPAPGPAREGWLALSDHTGTVWFRSLRVKGW